jgi:hypothetical protein
MARVVGCFMMALMLAVGVAGCSYIPFMHSDKGEQKEEKAVRTLWKSGEQYVAIEKQDRQSGVTMKPNEHLTEISVERIRNALESIYLRAQDKDKSISLFNEPELKILPEYIAEGLALSGPDEDVTFVIIGNYVDALGFLKKRMVTTGRVFCQDGQINIIFGDIHRALTEVMGVQEDRRLNPFLTGTRAGSAGKLEGVLLPKPGAEIFAKLRSDWIVFQTKGSETPYSPPAARQDTVAAPGARTVTPAPAQDTGAAVQELRPVYRERPAPAAKKGTEERLMILNDLRNKKLITDEEYRTKRMDILNDL